jgi:SAM-dependent methyltransferase
VETVVEFYAGYDEEGRLARHPVEFIATTYLLNRWIPAGSRVLDVGAGTGVYSLYLTSRGHNVTAVDIVPRHVRLIRSKVAASGNPGVTVFLGDARDLSRFEDGEFDAVLCMGPVYHLDGVDVQRALGECIRVLRRGGVIFVAYVHKYDGYERDRYREVFRYRSRREIEGLVARYPLRPLCHTPVDGTAFAELEQAIVEFPDDLLRSHAWLDAHPSLFDPSGIEGCVHGCWIGRREDAGSTTDVRRVKS